MCSRDTPVLVGPCSFTLAFLSALIIRIVLYAAPLRLIGLTAVFLLLCFGLLLLLPSRVLGKEDNCLLVAFAF